MYIFAESGKGLHKENDPADFRIDLGTTLQLDGKWEIALLDIDLPTMTKKYQPMYITLFSNICSESIDDGVQRPILYRLFKSSFRSGKAWSIENPRYIPLSASSVRTIRVYLLDHRREKPSFQQGRTTCTLHLKKV